MKLHLVLGISVLILAGCTQKKEQPITKAEAIAYAENITASFKKNDRDFLEKVLDVDLFVDEVMKVAGDKGNRSLRDGIKKGLQSRNLSMEVFNSTGKNGLYEFLKQYEKEGHQHIIFRLYGESGINYHDFELVKYDNKINAKDIYIYLSGENLSTTMAQIFSSILEQSDGSNKLMNQYAENMTKLKALLLQKNYKAAKTSWDQLPLSLKNEKAFQLVNLQITSEMDDESYITATNEFEKLYGNDASLQFAMFDGYFLRGDYTKSLRVLDRVDSAVNDPLLDYFRALVYTQKKDDKTAIAYLEKLYKKMPYFETGVLELMANYIEARRYDETNALITNYKKNKSFDQSRLADMEAQFGNGDGEVNW
jgi:hypothetical protein